MENALYPSTTPSLPKFRRRPASTRRAAVTPPTRDGPVAPDSAQHPRALLARKHNRGRSADRAAGTTPPVSPLCSPGSDVLGRRNGRARSGSRGLDADPERRKDMIFDPFCTFTPNISASQRKVTPKRDRLSVEERLYAKAAMSDERRSERLSRSQQRQRPVFVVKQDHDPIHYPFRGRTPKARTKKFSDDFSNNIERELPNVNGVKNGAGRDPPAVEDIAQIAKDVLHPVSSNPSKTAATLLAENTQLLGDRADAEESLRRMQLHIDEIKSEAKGWEEKTRFYKKQCERKQKMEVADNCRLVEESRSRTEEHDRQLLHMEKNMESEREEWRAKAEENRENIAKLSEQCDANLDISSKKRSEEEELLKISFLRTQDAKHIQELEKNIFSSMAERDELLKQNHSLSCATKKLDEVERRAQCLEVKHSRLRHQLHSVTAERDDLILKNKMLIAREHKEGDRARLFDKLHMIQNMVLE